MNIFPFIMRLSFLYKCDRFVKLLLLVRQVAVVRKISNLKTEYPNLYSLVLERLSEYNTNLVSNAK